MKKFFIILLISQFIFSGYSCKKTIEDKKENFVIDMLTKGDWYIDEFTISGADSAVIFKEYSFRSDKTGGVKFFYYTTTGEGTWKENLETYTITTNFPSVEKPVSLLNSEWKIIRGYLNFCEAKTFKDGENLYMMLRKK